jgi:hypothetical protein
MMFVELLEEFCNADNEEICNGTIINEQFHPINGMRNTQIFYSSLLC